MTLFALILSFTLSFHPSVGASSYTIEKQAVLDATVWTETACGVEACSMRVYQSAVGTVEQVRIRASNQAGSSLSAHAWTLLALDWSGGSDMPVEYTGNGAMQGTCVKVLLPSSHWTVVYSYQGAIPVYVKATCDQDYTHDGIVNLSDLVAFARYWNWKPPLSELAAFGRDYQQRTREWR